jgi:hypothetical protein
MYDRFSDKGAHSAEWFEVTKNFLKLAFAGDRREAKCPCNRCQNRIMLSENMRYLVTLLSTDLCQTTWCGNNMERCRQSYTLSWTETMMRTEWMT